MRHCLPSQLFEIARSGRQGAFEVVHVPVKESDFMRRLCGAQESYNAFYLDNGYEVLSYLEKLFKILTPRVTPSLAAQLAPGHSKAPEWTRHRREISRILWEFLQPAESLPVVLLTHGMCMTDYCTVRIDFGDLVERGDSDCAAYRSDSTVKMRFRPPVAGRHERPSVWPKNYIRVHLNRLAWMYPDGMSVHTSRFTKYWEKTSVLRGTDIKTSCYRERLGPAAMDSIEHRPLVSQGLFPWLATSQKDFGLWEAPNKEKLIIPKSRNAADDDAIRAGGFELVNNTGVWDAQIFKAQRLFIRPGSRDSEDVLFDEVTLLFDRDSSRLVCITVVHDELAYDLEKFDRTLLGAWLRERT